MQPSEGPITRQTVACLKCGKQTGWLEVWRVREIMGGYKVGEIVRSQDSVGIGTLKRGAWIYPKSNGREVESRLADGTHIAESSLWLLCTG